MKVGEKNNFIYFKPIGYEFPNLNPKDKNSNEYDLNWLIIQFKFIDTDGNKVVMDEPCMLTFDMDKFINDLSKSKDDFFFCFALPRIEQTFDLTIMHTDDIYRVKAKIIYIGDDAKIKTQIYEQVLNYEEFLKFLYGLKDEYKEYPIR